MISFINTINYTSSAESRTSRLFAGSIKYGILFIVIMFSIHSKLAAQGSVSFTLSDVIELALKNNPDISIAEYQVTSSGYSVSEAKGNYLPKVTLNGKYNRNIDKQVIFLPEGLGPGGATEIGSDNNFSTYLDLSIPVYSKSNFTNREYAQHNFQLQTEVLRGTRQAIIVNVKKSYFAHLAALAAVRVREKGLENSLEMNMKKTPLICIAVFGFLSSYSQESNNKYSIGVQYNHEFVLGGYVRVREWELPGDKMKLRDLGMTSYSAVQFHVEKRLRKNKSLTFVYDHYFMRGSATFDRNITYNGTIIIRYMHLFQESEEDTNIISTLTAGPYLEVVYHF